VVKMVFNRLGKYVVYDKRGKVVIITKHRKIAERYIECEK
jgi:hypothetical protein